MANRGTQELTKKSQTAEAEPSRGLQRSARGASPFGLVSRMMNDMDRLFGSGGLGLGFMPQIEVQERDGQLTIHADLPGLDPKDVEVNVEDDVLTLRGERRSEHEDEREGVYHSERSYGRFERSIALPPGTDPNAIEAKFENGVLVIKAPLPKESRRGKRIDVRSSSDAPTRTDATKTSH